MATDKLDKKIAKVEEIIAQKNLLIDTAKADIKEATKELNKLRKEKNEQGFTDLRKVIEKQGLSPTEVIDLIKS
jgi:allophanate hydrolase subunit 1